MRKRFFLENDEGVQYVYSEIREYVDEKHTPTLLRNDELCKLLNEQQFTILQLKQENKELKKQLNKENTMNKQLREINKKIGDDLYNCRVNKNIISKEKDEKINELEKRWNECEKFRYQVFQRLNELNKD